MNKPVLPTLMGGTADELDTIEGIALYLIQYSLLSPGFTSSEFPDQQVSFRELNAKHGDNKDHLANVYESKLTAVMRRYFPSEGVSVTVEHYDITINKYGLRITIMQGDQAVIALDKITIEGDNVTFEYDKLNNQE